MSFKDHFSSHAKDYAASRPDYPPALFEFIANLPVARDLAWDCATGNGQAALALATYFERVVATDASAEQIQRSFPHQRIDYRCEAAESTSFEDASVDLITVAQALHWFDSSAFYREAKRVLKPRGHIVIWSYGLTSIRPDIDALVTQLYDDTLGAYWPPERRHVENAYRELGFPFERIQSPALAMEKQWSLQQFCSYLNSWSALQRFRQDNPTLPSPLEQLQQRLTPLWEGKQLVRWPLTVIAGTQA